MNKSEKFWLMYILFWLSYIVTDRIAKNYTFVGYPLDCIMISIGALFFMFSGKKS